MMNTVQDLMLTGMSYVLDLEEKIGAAAPKMMEGAHDPELKELFGKTATKSKEYAGKIEATFAKLGAPVQRNDNHIVAAMVTEVDEMIKNTQPGAVRDAALIIAANQQQSLRVASYGSLEGYAQAIGKQDAAQGLVENKEDSKGGDGKFTELAESRINPEAAKAA